jgi:hypothetical protein
LRRGLVIFFALATLLAVSVELGLRARDRAYQRRMELAAERELLGGGLAGLLRARAMALAGATVGSDTEAAATLALTQALLASEYGRDEANAALAAARQVAAAPRASQRAKSLELAARALVEVAAGHLDRAEGLARRSVSLGHRQASPLFVLGRIRLRQGNLVAASHAFQAALVREPGFVEARVAWAEVRLEQGQHERAKEALLVALRRTPDHGRAQLLLAEVEPGGSDTSETWPASCARDEGGSPFLASACDLARARQAARRGDRDAATRFAEAAGRHHPVEPRACGGAAQLLASLGVVDRAARCLDEARRGSSPALPALRWAELAVALGRGHSPAVPADLAVASSPWAPALRARIALSSGGTKALAATLHELGIEGGELAPFVALAKGDSGSGQVARGAGAPAWAYVEGLRAGLDGKPARAAELLAEALAQHADACRAAGEYLAACRLLARIPDAEAFAWLSRENSRCVNLPAAVAAAAKRRHRRPRP